MNVFLAQGFFSSDNRQRQKEKYSHFFRSFCFVLLFRTTLFEHEYECTLNKKYNTQVEEEEDDYNGGFKVEMVEFPPQAVVGAILVGAGSAAIAEHQAADRHGVVTHLAEEERDAEVDGEIR